jgi:hypothetical protein
MSRSSFWSQRIEWGYRISQGLVVLVGTYLKSALCSFWWPSDIPFGMVVDVLVKLYFVANDGTLYSVNRATEVSSNNVKFF